MWPPRAWIAACRRLLMDWISFGMSYSDCIFSHSSLIDLINSFLFVGDLFPTFQFRRTHKFSIGLIRVLPFIFCDKRTKANINHRKSLNCFSKYSLLRSKHFCMRLNQLSKHFCHSDWGISKTCILNASTAFSGV